MRRKMTTIVDFDRNGGNGSKYGENLQNRHHLHKMVEILPKSTKFWRCGASAGKSGKVTKFH